MIMLSKLEKIMEKNEFKKMMKKENKAFKNYYVYEMILILLLAIIVILNITKTENLSEFKIMSDEIINVKYSNRNAPSLIFNSFFLYLT